MLNDSRTRNVPVIALLVMLAGMLGACSTPQVASMWTHAGIQTNGIDDEWPGDPLLVDDDLGVAVRVINDHQTLGVCIEVRSERSKQHLAMDGLTVWIDPKGGNDQVFGIHLAGGLPMTRGHNPPVSHGDAPTGDETPQSKWKGSARWPTQPLPAMAITYRDTTGPLTMAMDEIRRTGIDIGVGVCDDRSLIYEFKIAFNAAPSLAKLAPETVIGIGILSGGAESGRRPPSATDNDTGPGGPAGGGSAPGPGGRMGRLGGKMEHGPGGPQAGSKATATAVWLRVRLAADEIQA